MSKKYILSQTKGDEVDISLSFDTVEEAQFAAMELVQATQVQFAAEVDEGEIYEAPEPVYYDIIEFLEPSYMSPEAQERYRLMLEEEERERLAAEEVARLAEEALNQESTIEPEPEPDPEDDNVVEDNIEDEIIEEEIVDGMPEEIIEENNEDKGESE